MNWPAPSVEPDYEQASQYPALGFVPCPGHTDAIDSVASEVRSTTTALSDIVALLRGTGDGQWRGRSAEAFRERFDDDFKPKVEVIHESFLITARALEDWAAYVPGQQSAARALEERAQELKSQLDALPPPASFEDLAQDLATEDEEAAEEAAANRRQVEQDRQRLQSSYDEVRRKAEALRDSFVEYGESIADRIGRAMDLAPNEPGMFARIGNALVDAANWVADRIGDIAAGLAEWIVENAQRIAAIGDVLAVASTYIGLLAFGFAVFVGGGALATAALAGVSAGFAGAALVCHGAARLAGADVSLRSIGQDALGAIPVVGVFARAGGTIGRAAHAVSKSDISTGLGNVSLTDSIVGLVGDSSALNHFVPRNPRQWGEMALTGGWLLVSFENAWRSGGEDS
ncbi:putative T7SS-secreted protein [Streptomyces triticirhizae]|uniref:Putative T7SS secretion signal domain-containing protein n=1 Tax=Streptomyces triticirhizae TaxID=2483353 RepID=A0A3M2LH62_9ACTN|nr:hypothetical protein [Streptomyces triticirhizae]RMI36847.1 hypothetical protein EBN88_20450 [Streptomyces triticirhizae]